MVLVFEMVAEMNAHPVFTGYTKPFQAGFVQRQIAGASVKFDPLDTDGEYYRAVPDVDLADEAACVEFLRGILDSCLQASPVVVRVEDTLCDLGLLKQVMAPSPDHGKERACRTARDAPSCGRKERKGGSGIEWDSRTKSAR